MSYGRVPAGSVVVSGSLPKDGRQVQPVLRRSSSRGWTRKTRAKTSLNDLLRD